MGKHDKYGKKILKKAANGYCEIKGESVEVDYGEGKPARIDGTVKGKIAVEIESRTSKQIRGAVLDLISHKYPQKLLILLPVHMSDAKIVAKQCENIMKKYLCKNDFEVIVLDGHGDDPKEKQDIKKVKSVLKKLL